MRRAGSLARRTGGAARPVPISARAARSGGAWTAAREGGMGQRRYRNKRRRPSGAGGEDASARGNSAATGKGDGTPRTPDARTRDARSGPTERTRFFRARAPKFVAPQSIASGAAAPRSAATAPVLDPALGTELRATDEELPHTTLSGVPAASGGFGRAIDALGTVFALLFVVVTAIILFEIFMRYVFRAPTTWVHETTSFLTAIGFIFGGLYALAKDKHIRVVLLYDKVRGRARRTLDIAISVIGLVTVGFFAYAAWTTAQKAWFSPSGGVRLETTGSLFNAPYPAFVKGFLLVVVLAMAVQFIVLIVNYARGRGAQS